MVTHFNATLGMGGWLNLTQQGLSPCKKYKTSRRSSAKSYRIIELVHLPYLFVITLKKEKSGKLTIIFILFFKTFKY